MAAVPPPASAPVPEEERGSLTISERAVAGIAAQAAADLLRARLGTSLREAFLSRPRAHARVKHRSRERSPRTRVRLGLDLPFPADAPGIGSRLRTDVAAKVEELTGLPAPGVTVEVERLVVRPLPHGLDAPSPQAEPVALDKAPADSAPGDTEQGDTGQGDTGQGDDG